jgi:AcrR family transcriptional regulator
MTPTTRKPSGVRRREIAQAALRVIGLRGATSLTAASLAREVGLTPGALFRHFATVDDILCAAADLAIELIEETFPPTRLAPVERLRTLARGRIDLISGTPGLAWLLLSDQVYLCVPDAAVDRLRALVERSRAFILAALGEGVERGDLRADLDPRMMLPIFTGTVHSLIVARGVHREADAAPQTEPTLGALFTLLAPPPTKDIT